MKLSFLTIAFKEAISLDKIAWKWYGSRGLG
jgi:hypothetical protein